MQTNRPCKSWKKTMLSLLLAAALLLPLSVPAVAEDLMFPSDHTGVDTPSGLTLNRTDHNAYISGSNGLFRPEDHITRAETAQLLSRLLAYQVPAAAVYADVPRDAWYAQAAGMLGALGVLRAGESLFLPEDEVTRGEFIHALSRFFPAALATSQFADVSPWDPWASDYLTARALGWVYGFEDGTLRPEQPITRAEAATLVNRALGRFPDRAYIDASVGPLLYWDVSTDDWYFYDVMEASVPHQYDLVSSTEFWSSHTAVSAGISAGFHLVNGWLYYYDQERGGVVRNASVGSFTFDAAGHFTSGNADLDARLRQIVMDKTNGSMTQEEKLRALYVYTRDSFTYLRRPAYEFGVLDFMEKDALNMLTTGYGNCYSYASVFWYLSRWIGYDAKIYSGTVGTNKRPHSWVEINFDGRDYIFDTELEMAYHKKGRYEINLYRYIDVDNWVYIK